MVEEEKSEFGKGCVYCLGLFLAHKDRWLQRSKNHCEPSIWCYAAADHLIEFEIPENFPDELKNRMGVFHNHVMTHRLSLDIEVTNEDVEWELTEAEALLMEIDKQLGLKPIKGDYN